MAGHLAVPALTGRRDLPATLAREVVTDLLRGELGFDGLAVSDALDMGAVTGGSGGVDVAGALQAGTDLLLCGPDPAAQAGVEAGLAAAFAGGTVDAGEAAASVGRLAALRAWMTGFEQPSTDVVGSAEHRALAAELATRSITLIRDRDSLVPLRLAADTRILVIEPRPRLLTPADTTASLPAGGLAAAIRVHHPGADGVVVEADVSDVEIAGLRERAAAADLVVLGTVDALGSPSVAALARALVATGTPVVAVALRGPWDADAYPEVGTVLATYGIQAPSLQALAAALVGDQAIGGRLPVRITPTG
jgi:beta-N-acetylhexosaminidase